MTAALDEAETLLSAAITFLEKTDYRKQLARDLANRGVVRDLRWHDPRALEDHRRALELDPAAQQSRINLARHHLVRGEFNPAADPLLAIPEDERTYEVHRLIGEARHLAGRSREALPFLEAALEQAEALDERTPVLAVLFDAYLSLEDRDAAAGLEARLEAEAPDDPDALTIRAQAAFRRRDYEGMVDLYERALAQPGDHSVIQLDYANHLYRLERWSEAADQYTQVVTADAFEAPTRHYAVALLNAGRYREALDFSRAVRQRHGVRLGVTEVEARVLRWLGDVEAALALRQALHELEPDNHGLKLGLTETLVLARDFDRARDVIGATDWRGLTKRAEDVMRVAQLRGMLGLPDALRLAWEALRLAPNGPDLHRHFTNLAVQMGDDAFPADVDEVTSDSVVTLERDDGTTFTLSILEGRDDLRAGEIAPDSPQAQRLLGRRVGDELAWGSGLVGDRKVKIQSVIPALLHAVRSSLAEFNERFPDHPGPVLFRGRDARDTADTLLRVLTRMEEARRPLVEQCLQDPRLPIHLLADKVLGVPLHQLRDWARSAPGRRLHAFDGRPWQTFRQRVGVQRAKRIVVDDSALLTLAELDLLDALTERFDEVLVPASLMTELDGLVLQRTGRLEPDHLPADLGVVQKVRAWLPQHATRMPTYARLTLAAETLDRTDDTLGDATADALYLAHELGVPLFTDDLGLNLMAENAWQVRPTNSLQHLQELHTRKRLTFGEYVGHLAALSRWHYDFIGVSADLLVEAFRTVPQGDDFRQLVGELALPRASETSALRVGADTIWALLNIRTVDYRLCLDATKIVLDALAERTDARFVALYMVRNVLRRHLNDPPAQAIYVELFRKVLWDWVDRRGLLNEPVDSREAG